MKSFYYSILLLFVCGMAKAQLPNGAVAPTWTLDDFQTGETYSLQDYIDQGIPCIIDFSATWCPPCWNYHQGHVLADMYDEYGPTGTEDPNTAMVFFIEGDYGTNDACLYGDNANCTGNTMGDWTVGTPYPIFNIPASSGLTGAYQIGSWPTLYAISPRGTAYVVGQASKSTWESWLFETFALQVDQAVVSEIVCPEDGGSIDITVSGGVGNITYLWSNGDTTEDLIGAPAGTYTVSITEGRGYEITETYEILQGPDPLQASLTGQDVLCNGDGNGEITAEVEGGVGTYEYLWSNGMTTPTISGLSGDTYSVVVTDDNGCTIMQTFTIAEPSVLEHNQISFPASCGEASGQVALSGIGGVAPYVYTLNGEVSSTGVYMGVDGGGYVASIEDSNGCGYQFSVIVDEIEEPVAVVEVSEQPTCDNPQVILSGDGSSFGSNFSYMWSSPDGGTIVDGQGTLYPTVEGNGTYILQVTDSDYNCVVEASATLESDQEPPSADAGADQTITCDVLEVVLDGSASSEGGNFTYEWSTNDGNIVGGANTTMATVNAAGTYSIIVTNTDNGCTSSASVMVEQTADLPEANAGEEQVLTCSTTLVMLDGSASDSGDNITYNWTTADGTLEGATDGVTAQATSPGSYLLEVTNTASGCVSYASVIVTENTSAPSATVEAAAELTCVLVEQMLSVTVDADQVTYAWTTADGNIVSGADSATPTIDAPGTYVVSYTDEITGCDGTQEVVVSEFINTPESDFVFTADGQVFTFEDNSTGGPTSYFWDFGDGNTSEEENPTHEFGTNGTYQVCLTITNECGESQSCTVITISIGTSTNFQSALTSLTCNGQCDGTITIEPVGNQEELTVEVTGPDGFSSTGEYELTDLCAGTYEIVITNNIGEKESEQVVIGEPSAIEIVDSEVTEVNCFGLNNGMISLDVEGGTGDLEVVWSNDVTGTVIDNLAPDTYTATITDEQGCQITKDFVITEPTEIDVDAVEIVSIDENNPTGSIDIEVTGGVGPYEFLWSHGEVTEDVDGLDFGEYTVIVTDANGCSDTYGPYEVKNLVNVKEVEALKAFVVSPNPASESIVVELEFLAQKDARISIVNSLGQEVMVEMERGVARVNKTYEVSTYPAGLYFVKVQVGQEVSIRKIVKQ